jgi:hypothetical protein
MVWYHRLALSSPPIPVVTCLRSPLLDKRQSIFFTSSTQKGNLGSPSKCTVVPSLPSLCRHSSRRKKSTAFSRSTWRRVILYRPSQLRLVCFVQTTFYPSQLTPLSRQVTGRIITGSNINDSFAFLDYTQPIWAKSPDTPRLPSPSDSALSDKLVGHCVWPLSISIARTVDAPTGAGDTRSFRLPETFLERYTKVSVQYDLTINVSRGKLRADSW